MTSRYGVKAYGKGVYSGPDLYVLDAEIVTSTTTPGEFTGDFAIDGMIEGQFSVLDSIQFIGLSSATVYCDFSVEGVIEKLTGFDATVDVVFDADAVISRMSQLGAEIVIEPYAIASPYLGAFWVADTIDGEWVPSPSPDPGPWTQEVIPTVDWSN